MKKYKLVPDPRHAHWNPEAWVDHPTYPVCDWQHDVNNDDTRQSYVEWVNSQLQADIDDEEARKS